MKKTLVLTALSLLLWSPLATAQASNGEELRTRVDVLLGGIEYVPSEAEWTGLGPDAAAVLAEVAADASRRASTRARATSALAFFPQPTSVDVARRLLADAKTPLIVQRKALRTLAVLDPDALTLLAPYLAHENQQLRESAVNAISLLRTAQARAALEARATVEPAEHIRASIATSLKGMGE